MFKIPTPLEAALACVDAWLAGDNLHLIGEGEGYLAKLREIATPAQVKCRASTTPGSPRSASITASVSCGPPTVTSPPSRSSRCSTPS